MNPRILDSEVQQFIRQKSDASVDITKLILAGSPFEGVTAQELAQQIIGRQKAKNKLPSWYKNTGIYYPPKLNIEQTSSEITAAYKSTLVSGKLLFDSTGGLGIDDYYFSKTIASIIHCELNKELSDLAQHNFTILSAFNISCTHEDGLEALKKVESVDWIYIDPSRRHDQKGKVFFLEDCEPNVPENLDFLFTKTHSILIKTSPLLDLNAGIKSLKHVKEIHVVAIENEVKELLWVLDKKHEEQYCTIKTINLLKHDTQQFSFIKEKEGQQSLALELPQKFLYEPNAAILKSGGFLSVGNHFKLKKIHLHSHLYTSKEKIDFPGRRFKIINSFPYHKKNMAKAGISKANITTRNFPESVANLRKKHKIKDGGDIYLFFTIDLNENRIVLLCEKL